MSEQQQQPLDPQDIEAYLLGVLPEYRVEALDQSLRSDPVALQQLAEAMQVMSLVRQEFAGQAQYQAANEQEPLLDDFNTLLKELGEREAAAEPITLTPADAQQHKARIETDKLTARDLADVGGYVFRKTFTSKPAIYTGLGAAAAAVLLLALILINPFASSATDPVAEGSGAVTPPITDDVPALTNAVATLTATHNAQWAHPSAERALTRGSALHPGTRLTLTAGFAEITTNRGAIAILEAPATIELLNNDSAMRLHAGRLIGLCHTESSKGFVVKTDHADITDITDLGTRFGVHATADGVETTVFVGEIAIKTADAPSQVVTQSQTARVSLVNNRPTLVIQNQLAEGFASLLASPLIDPLARFRPRVEGEAIAWVGAMPDDLRSKKQVSGKLQVYLERQDVLLGQALDVDLTPEVHTLRDKMPAVRLDAGQRVDVYLLHLDSTSGEEVLVQGTIQFDRPILGVITTGTKLLETDALLGDPSARYPDNEEDIYRSRGCDRFSVGFQDEARIAGTSLELSLSVKGYIDQIRILVASEQP